MASKKIFIFSILPALILGIILGITIDKQYLTTKKSFFRIVREKGFQYTSPFLYLETPQEDTPFVTQLNNQITDYITQSTQKGLAKNISVYIRFPFLSDWTVINGDEKYSPASLLKVPVMMVYLKNSENNPSLLSEKLNFDMPDENQQMNYKAINTLKEGNAYTIGDLLKRMIVYSDNNAEDVLTKNINQQDFSQIFDDIQINRLDYAHQEDSMNVQTYSYFFRVLYNSSFLNRQISEDALKMLSQTTFTEGIVAGVPKNIIVAHKFGERAYADSGVKQLHDCGIVYYTKNPYLLCIMTRGDSFNNLQSVIKNISAITYNYTQQQSALDQNSN